MSSHHGHSHGHGHSHSYSNHGNAHAFSKTDMTKYDDNTESNVDPDLEELEASTYRPATHYSPKGALNNIHDGITNLPLDSIEEILTNNPESANQPGWNALVPLHRAVMRGDMDVIRLLLKHGSDPNAKNNFGETPVHYAAKRGNPAVIHMLLNAGGDINAQDRMGRTVMHHAAQGGSVLPLHYLWEVHSMSYNAIDCNLNTPLHLACAQGHLEILRYLIKKENRGDVAKRDINGNNSLHISAKYGYGPSCWHILCAGGVGLLRCTNKDGKTPLDLALEGKDYKYKNIVSMLTYFAKKPNLPDDYKPEGPRLAWLAMLVIPTAYYLLLLTLCHMVSFPGLTMAAGSLAFFIWYGKQGHRIKHFASWPNLLQIGTFAAGLVFSFLCHFCVIVPELYAEHTTFVYLTIFLSPVFFVVYIRLILLDSGSIAEPARKDNGSLYTVRDIGEGNVKLTAFCDRCEMIPPKNIKHCRLCDKCYYEMDHHCLFINNCVAFRNHRQFIFFLLFLVMSIVFFFYGVYQYLNTVHKDISFSLHWIMTVCSLHPWIASAVVVDFMCGMWAAFLLKLNLDIISMGHTALTMPDLKASPRVYSCDEITHNCTKFFLRKRLPPANVKVKYIV